MPAKKSSTPDFETAMKELEQIVESMENDQLTLDESLQKFERGVELSRICQENLKKAEQKVEQLVKKHGQLVIEPFNDDQEST
ncbi:MAG TPA: exodeoxyribonuclease VII small subunit [Gammaproteobacteria bacterium]|nr:exodeoxyribonuclease 7 small subunit [bacterium BMS3Abin11]GMT40164.1 MAG: exodeoxyribonuclease 7 small subunit [bacterium]HDH16054.1 exodeoxyribonuclease VII small subunit [Gammaproteobacteria bacterium]